jgi:flagella basal body P-ring formation protein FlgA
MRLRYNFMVLLQDIGKKLEMIKQIKLIYLALLTTNMVFAADWQQDLQQQVHDMVMDQLQYSPEDQVAVDVPLPDARLQIKECQQPVRITPTGQPNAARRNVTVMVQCPDAPGWTIPLGVKVSIQKPVIVATTSILKGEALTADNVTVQYIDAARRYGDMLTDLPSLLGAKAKRNLQDHQPVRQSQICLVCKDDQIDIYAEQGTLVVKTSGRALQDGGLNDSIRVENSRSKRIVSAQVSGVGAVRVKM